MVPTQSNYLLWDMPVSANMRSVTWFLSCYAYLVFSLLPVCVNPMMRCSWLWQLQPIAQTLWVAPVTHACLFRGYHPLFTIMTATQRDSSHVRWYGRPFSVLKLSFIVFLFFFLHTRLSSPSSLLPDGLAPAYAPETALRIWSRPACTACSVRSDFPNPLDMIVIFILSLVLFHHELDQLRDGLSSGLCRGSLNSRSAE